MGKAIYYRQCELVKVDAAGRHVQICYIPESLASLNSIVNIDAEPGDWRVTAVYPTRAPEEEIIKRSRRHLKQREASDI